MMKANNLPTLNIPEDPPSFDIISKLSKGDPNETKINSSQEELEMEITQREQSETKSTSQDTIFIQGKRKYKVKREDTGLKIYTKETTGWPVKNEFTRKDLVDGLKGRKYKFTFSKNELSEEEIIKMIENKVMEITSQCFSIVENSIFAKIRTGLIEEPPPQTKIRNGCQMQTIHNNTQWNTSQ